MIDQRLRSILGADGVIEIGVHGPVVVSPRSEEECALILLAAHEQGWSVRFVGGGGWIRPDAPADLIISTRLLVGITDLSPADLVLTARAGTSLDDLQTAGAREGMWIPLDPPGAKRSIGSVLATGTTGPLRAGFGTVKSQILGLTLITADGRIVRVGGRVVKNVAGFDLTSLAVGSFGAFGLITSAHIRLRALPKADLTLIVDAQRDVLLEGALAILSAGQTPAALELFSLPTTDTGTWTLAIRVLGSEATVAADWATIAEAVPQFDFDVVDGDLAAQFWTSASTRALAPSTTVRMGSQPSELRQALDLLAAHLDNDGTSVSVSILAGVTRCSCNSSSRQIQELRLLAAQRDWPVTLERAPLDVRETVGHYGAYRDGVGRLVTSLRGVFDPLGTLIVPLGGAP